LSTCAKLRKENAVFHAAIHGWKVVGMQLFWCYCSAPQLGAKIPPGKRFALSSRGLKQAAEGSERGEEAEGSDSGIETLTRAK
jgi:hypothetical protein